MGNILIIIKVIKYNIYLIQLKLRYYLNIYISFDLFRIIYSY